MQRNSSFHLEEPSLCFNLDVFVSYSEENLFQLDFSSPQLDDGLFYFASVPLVSVVIQESPSSQDIHLVEPCLQDPSLSEVVHFGIHTQLESPVVTLHVGRLLPKFEHASHVY
jgi:hypothetical protein